MDGHSRRRPVSYTHLDVYKRQDLNTLFQYNMPFRAIAKMTGGMVSMEMVEGLLKVVNGHFSGLGKVISGFFRNQKLNKQYEKDLEEQK